MSFFAKTLKLATFLSTIGLAACSSTNTFTTKLNSFQNWPSDAMGKKYVFAQDSSKNLEYKTYADAIAKEMWKTGLSPAATRAQAQYIVDFKLNTELKEKLVQEYYDEPVIYPSFGFGFGDYGWGYSNSMFGGFNIGYAPRVATYPVQFNRYTLALEIKSKSGNPVYQATALADSNKASLMQIFPYLAASVFDNFPGDNGQVRHVEFDIDKSIEQQKPVKYDPNKK